MRINMSRNNRKRNTMKRLVLPFMGLFLSGGAVSLGASTMGHYTMTPPITEQVKDDAEIMLTLAADHQLFLPAYNDYDDLTGDGVPDITYSNDFEYTGYFDNKKCYSYVNEQFEPTANAPTAPEGGSVLQYCAGTEWSGNFLNWATMTRIDLVRQVLYGGYRSTDDENKTVLERSHLPHDAHSFAKYYNGDDIEKLADPSQVNGCVGDYCDGYTFCNTSEPVRGGHFSHELPSLNQPPLMRMVQGNYSLWAGGERFQCLVRGDSEPEGGTADNGEILWAGGDFPAGENDNNSHVTGIDAFHNSPKRSEVKDLIVRVKVCGENVSAGAHSCKSYDTGAPKPIGLLQEYGERGVKFGLMTRGYNANKHFGVLRKNISLFEEVNEDGTFIARPLPAAPDSDSIIATFNALRIVDYRYDFEERGDEGKINYRGTYLKDPDANLNDLGSADCAWGRNSFNNAECRNWGNPFSLLMAESYRYLAGAETASSPSGSGYSDHELIPGLRVADWNPPARTVENEDQFQCTNMNLLAFNASAVSYDDALAGRTFSDLDIGTEDVTVDAWTDYVGAQELLENTEYFVGRSGDDDDGQCTAKSITNLSEVRGTCPDAPRLEGAYAVAGLAHYVHTNDVLPDIGGSTIATYGVDLAGAQPNIPVNAGGRSLTIIPACRNKGIGGNCAIVQFKPIKLSDEGGSYLVGWEDSEQGGDYDQDMAGIIRYEVAGGTVKISLLVPTISTDNPMNFGFVISGTGTDFDGYYPGARVQDSAVACESEGNRGPCTSEGNWLIFSFSLGGESGSPGQFLEKPLYYAAKWGSFRKDISAEPTDQNSGGYAAVTNPARMRDQLEAIFEGIINRPTAGTAAAISASTLSGEGFIVQTLYQPSYSDNEERTVSWVGTLNGLFIDRFGNLREDTDGDRKLTDNDRVVEFVYVRQGIGGQTTVFNRYPFDASTGEPDTSNSEDIEEGLHLDQLRPLWSARDQLASVVDVKSQRNSGTETAADARLILAGTPNAEGRVLTAEDFDEERVADLEPWLDVDDISAATHLINYIRGAEIEGYRSRTVDWGDGAKVWRLGDIVHSTPAIVGRPSAGYDVMYGDDSYLEFREKYRNRRQMIYVGGNDGMLHAFNGGFFNPSEFEYELGGEAAHPLGAEMWGYVPYNLLPHLKWLAEPVYSHVYYVDGDVQTFDVNIFDPSETHPYGWGTILVAGMRLGGGDYTLETEEGEQTLKSAYIIMDITDPEAPPRLIAEVTHDDLGFTLGGATVVKAREPSDTGSYLGSTSQNEWHLLVGSGPDTGGRYGQGISSQPAKVFSLDLREAEKGRAELEPVEVDEGNKSFVGGLMSVDWNSDYQDDMVYFGVVGDHGRYAELEEGVEAYHGGLKHARLNFSGVTGLLSNSDDLLRGTGTNLPFATEPLTVRDRQNQYWVFAGSGRYLVRQDLELDLPHKYVGVKVNAPENSEPPAWRVGSSVLLSDLHPVSNDNLFVNGSGVFKVQQGSTGEYLDLYDYLSERQEDPGWYRDLPARYETNFSRSAFFDGTLVFNSYLPAVQTCQQSGATNQYVLDMFTGLPQYRLKTLFVNQDSEAINIEGEDYEQVYPNDDSIQGMGSAPTIINETVFTQTDGGEVPTTDITTNPGPLKRRSWREVPLDEVR